MRTFSFLYILICISALQCLSAWAQVGADPDPAFDNCKPIAGASAACNKAAIANCVEVAKCNSDPDPLGCVQGIKQVDLSTVCGDFSAGDRGKDEGKKVILPIPVPTPTPTPTPTPIPSPSSTPIPGKDGVGKGDPPSEADASQEVNACSNDTQTATGACDLSQANQFRSQVGTQNTGNVGQMNGAQQVNNVVTGCSNAIGTCSSTCNNSLQSAQAKCSGECSGKLNTQISQITTLQSTCSNLQNNLAQLQNAGNQVMNQQAQQQQQQNGNMSPSSANNNQQQQQAVAAPAGLNCSNPVNSAQCAVQQTQAAAKDSAGNPATMQSDGPMAAQHGAGSFNVGDPGRESQNAKFADGNNQNGQPQSNPMMPPGGGSSSGFGAGQSTNAAAGGGNPNMRAASAPKGPDVQIKEKSGGGFSSVIGRALASVGIGGGHFGSFGSSSSQSADDLRKARGLDLKQYLPGGEKDGTRRLSGANFAHPDVHPQTDNLLNVISNRFQVHCKLQLLFDCK